MRTIYMDKNIPRVLLTKAISPRWPGFVWTPFSSVFVANLPDPPLPGPRWLRVRNEMCGICASDLSLLYVHADPSIAPAALPASNRFYLGHEAIGRVIEIGSGVTRFKVGERVVMNTHFEGANCANLELEQPCRYCAEKETHFCENNSQPWLGMGGGFGDSFVSHETSLLPCPDDISNDQAVLGEPMAVAVHAVLRYPPPEGGRVLVVGAGIIGLSTVMTLHALFPSCEITALARYPHQQAMAEKLGAKHILTGRADYATIAELTGGKFYSAPLNKGMVIGGFDAVYDCVANAQTLTDSLRWARSLGTVVMIGSYLSPMKKVDLTPVWYSQVNLVGMYGKGSSTWQGRLRYDYEWVFDFLRDGRFQAEGLITHRFPMDAYKQAFAVALSKGKARAIKVVFEHG
jgi:threonine dehydrogenase-like Zn-dependent dehydrogenase